MGEPEIKPSVGDTMSANSQEGVGGGTVPRSSCQGSGRVRQGRGSKISITVDPCIVLSADPFLF